MTVLAYLIPASLLLGALGLFAFLWTVRSRQYEDLDGAAWRILIDDDKPLTERTADFDDEDAAPKAG